MRAIRQRFSFLKHIFKNYQSIPHPPGYLGHSSHATIPFSVFLYHLYSFLDPYEFLRCCTEAEYQACSCPEFDFCRVEVLNFYLGVELVGI
jgi:hypothetical protein